MKYVSENGKMYESEKACLEADKKYADEVVKQKADFEKQQKEKQAREKVRKEKAEDVQNAYQIYTIKLNEFIKDYGTYHTRFTISDMPSFLGVNELFKTFLDF